MTIHLSSLQDKQHPSQKSDTDKVLWKYVHQPAVILQVIASDSPDTEDSVIFEHKCQAANLTLSYNTEITLNHKDVEIKCGFMCFP